MANTPLVTPADVAWLKDERELLERLAGDKRPLHRIAAELRKNWSANQVALLLDQRELRTRAVAKFTAAGEMLFTRRGYEQATDEWLARYKARRFAPFASVADLCCGIGGDTAAMATGEGRLVACDHDPAMLALAEHNVRQLFSASPHREITWSGDDVRQFEMAGIDAWHIDPDRRAAGGRTTHVALHEPDDQTIDALARQNPHVAIKLAPASDPPDEWAAEGELEWISRGGECRQLVVWRGELAQSPGKRRATVLPRGGFEPLVSVVGTPEEIPWVDQVDRYCYEADAALLAADLVGAAANPLRLARFASTHAWLTGSEPVEHPALVGYEVLEVLPLKVKRIAEVLRGLGMGLLAIKHRAVTLDPADLMRQLRVPGDNQGVVMVTRRGEQRIALVCRPLAGTADERA
jgi:SAM-dependent methyltransferase